MEAKVIHCQWNDMPYTQFHADCERRHKAGQRQVYCRKCRVWVYLDQVAPEHKYQTMTAKEFERTIKEAKEKYG